MSGVLGLVYFDGLIPGQVAVTDRDNERAEVTVGISSKGGGLLGRKPELTERDIGLLTLLSRCRVLSMEQIKHLFGTADGHRKRIGTLEKRGYVIRKGTYVEVLSGGLRVVAPGQRSVQMRQNWRRENQSIVADIFLSLQGAWEFQFALEYKRKRDVNRSARFNAVISRDGIHYALYLLAKHLRERTLRSIKTQIGKLRRIRLSRAVVFYQSAEALRAFGDDHCGLDSLLLLPYPYGVSILKHRDEIYSLVRSRFRAAPCRRPFADYERGDTFITVLVDNDLAKRRHLLDYLTHVKDKENRRNIAVCLTSQKPVFEKLFPGIRLIALPEDTILRQKGGSGE